MERSAIHQLSQCPTALAFRNRSYGSRISVVFTIVPFTGADGKIAGIAATMRSQTARCIRPVKIAVG